MYNRWNEQTRLKYDSCARQSYDKQSQGFGLYHNFAPRYGTSGSLDNLAHAQRVNFTGHVGTDSLLRHAPLTNPREKYSLHTRPYGGCYMGVGQGTNDKTAENDLIFGQSSRPTKACNMGGVTINRFNCLPDWGNPQRVQHIVAPWQRGGDSTRDMVRQVNYSALIAHRRAMGPV